MALIKDQNKLAAQDAVVLDLSDLQRQAEILKQRAEQRAEQIVQEAQAERQRLLENAEKEGFDAGHQRGYEQGHQEGLSAGRDEAHREHNEALRSLESSWGEALEVFEARRADMLAEARSEVVRLAVAIARRVIKREIAGDEGSAVRQVEAALPLVIHPSRLRIVLHPDDAPRVREALPELTRRFTDSAHAELIEDDSVEPGSCVVRTDAGEIDASSDTQIERVVEALTGELAAQNPGGTGVPPVQGPEDRATEPGVCNEPEAQARDRGKASRQQGIKASRDRSGEG